MNQNIYINVSPQRKGIMALENPKEDETNIKNGKESK